MAVKTITKDQLNMLLKLREHAISIVELLSRIDEKFPGRIISQNGKECVEYAMNDCDEIAELAEEIGNWEEFF